MAQVRVRKRGKTYSYIYEIGKINGRRRVVERGGYKSRDAAYEAGIASYTDWKHGKFGITSENVALHTLVETWLQKVCVLNVKPQTVAHYETMYRCHIRDSIGDMPVKRLTPAIIDNWMHNMTAEGLSRSTLENVFVVLREALNYAVYPGEIISENPCRYIKVPKNAPTGLVKRSIISMEQMDELLDKYPVGHPIRVPILLLYHTGMRVGEVCGLSWDDIDFDGHSIRVGKQVRYISKQGYYFSDLKTESSARSIIIDDILIDELKKWRSIQAQNSLQRGGSYICVYRGPNDQMIEMSNALAQMRDPMPKVPMICTKESGALLRSDNIRKYISRNGLNSHSFRHTHATMLIEANAPAKGVAARLGHKSTRITEDLYTHATKKMQTDTACIFEKLIESHA